MVRETTERSFDELASGLASGSITRGKALRLMGAALVGGALASVGIGEAAADPIGCKRSGKKCKKNSQCCSGNCSGGTCAACASAEVLCNGSCVSTSCPTGQIFDPARCVCVAQCLQNGSFGCSLGTPCCSGTCSPSSPTGFCCNELGGTCTASRQCCSGQCDTDGTCCSVEGCTDNSDCCSSRPFCVDTGSGLGPRCLEI
jgi:hypothetical protein